MNFAANTTWRASKSSAQPRAARTSIHKQATQISWLNSNPESDLSPFDQFFDFAEALKTALGRRVDLVEAAAINNPYLRTAINKSRELVYAS